MIFKDEGTLVWLDLHIYIPANFCCIQIQLLFHLFSYFYGKYLI